MSCTLDNELLERHIDGCLDPLEAIIVGEHLKVCSHCSAYLDELNWLVQHLSSLPGQQEVPLRELTRLSHHTLARIPVSVSTLDILRDTAENCTRFIRFVPGASTASLLADKSLRAAPRVLWGLSRQVLRGGAKIAQVFV